MPAALIPLLFEIGLWIFKWLINKYANDSALLESFKAFSELARRENIRTIQERSEAEKQLISANKKWDQIEANEAAQSRRDGNH